MPNFKGQSGGGPFKMKAAAYGNNPMLKNFPSTFRQNDDNPGGGTNTDVITGTGGVYDKPQVMNVAPEDSVMKQREALSVGQTSGLGENNPYNKPIPAIPQEDSAMKQNYEKPSQKNVELDTMMARGRAATGTEGMYRGAPTPTRRKKKY